MSDILGVSFDAKRHTVKFENGDTGAGRKLLWNILQRMASSDFEFADVEKVDDREAFIAEFARDAVKAKPKTKPDKTKPTKASAKPTGSSASGRDSANNSRAKPKDHAVRPELAPKAGARTFHVDA